MAKGNCGLCKQWRKLSDSHLLPEAIYAYLRFGNDGIKSSQAPFVLDDTSTRRDFAQIKKPFLCGDCETRFNGHGESWVLENCRRRPNRFPLEERLRTALNRTRWPGGWIVYADDFPKLLWERLAYFAVSIFWRAGVTDWKVGKKRVLLPLPSRHEQEMRKYLLGEGAFPDQAVVSVAIATRRESITQAMHYPTCDEKGTYNHYRVAVPGMLFDMLLGTDMPPIQRDHCIVRGHRHPIYLLDDNWLFAVPVARQFPRSVPTRALAQEFLPPAIFNLTAGRFPK